MNTAMLSLMSGPLMALLRYGVAIGATAAASKWGMDNATIKAVSSGILAAGAAAIGTLSSTKAVNIARVADLPGYSVTTPMGTTLDSAADASRANLP